MHFSIIALCFLAAAVQGRMTKEDAMAMFTAAAHDCQAEGGASDADIEMLIAKTPNENHETKCVGACMMKKFQFMTADGKLSKEAIVGAVNKFTDNDAEKAAIAGEIVDKCSQLSDPDICEAACKYAKCLKEEKEARGIECEM